MKIIRSIACICLLSISGLHAQTKNDSFEKDFDRAEKIFSKVYQDGKDDAVSYSKGGYTEALPLLLDLYKQEPLNMNLAFKLGICYQSSRRERAQAIPYFSKAVTAASDDYKGSSYKEKRAPLIAYKYLGDAYHLNYQFDKAIEAYDKYLAVMAGNKISDKAITADINRRIEMCKTGKRLMATPVKLKIQNLGSAVNSSYADYSPVLSADQNTLFFTSRRPETTGGQKDDEGNYLEDIYMSTRTKAGWTKASNIGAPINTDGNEATVGLSPDGQTILIYKDDNGDGNIYSTTLDGDVWSTPVKLNENINSKYWEPSAFISADGNTIYFTSNRPGGYGGRDLYTSKRSPEGDWSKAVNMGPSINTPYDEDAPFIHPDGVTLSFSSNGHNTMGGFDIFTSLLSDDGNWSEPVNVGYPVNTTDDDIFYVVSPDSRKAYFTSFRDGGLGEKDNYMVTFLDRKETPLTLMKGIVNDESGKPAKQVEITVTDNETGQVVGIYHTNSKTGQFLFILTPGKNYNITYQAKGHLFYSENMEIPKKSNYYEIDRAVSLNPIVVGSKITLNNIFFDFDKATLRSVSNVELKNLVLLLKSNPNLKVEIAGHTDSKGDDAYNQKLSEERAMAVVNRLAAGGISADRMKAKGYGKTMPVAPNKKANGTDNPEGRQQNRRVELKITEIN
ncbi:MAG TPA: OmpA family protein [Bacteroidia bacterium]|jgi:outer membrane protein OmpA-like peptidoglycan-associated protein|nr:OmpA family protein [Bacteroidia bacterium]